MCEYETIHSTLLMALRAAGADAANRQEPPSFDLWMLLNQTFTSLCRASQLPRKTAEEAWLEGYRRLQRMVQLNLEGDEEEPCITNTPGGDA